MLGAVSLSALKPQTIVVANKRITLPESLLVFAAEVEKAKKIAEKMSKGPTLYQLLFPAN
jgi:hypothetical protein